MIRLENTVASYETLAKELETVANGTHYLRVTSDGNHVFFEAVAKEKGFFGRITQFFIRLFDSSYNINKGSALIFTTLDHSSDSAGGADEFRLRAENALVRVVTHVNEERFFAKKADLPQWAQTAAKTAEAASNVTSSRFLIYRTFKEGLEKWVKEGTGQEQRAVAQAKILACFSNKTAELDLSHMGLTTLPPEIGKLDHVTDLNLYNNKLLNLPAAIGHLRSLKNLSLSANKLETLPEQIGNLASLETLDLAVNHLTALPKTMGNLASLQKLYIGYNNLTELPKETENLKSLKSIDLLQNKNLKSIPENLCKLASLEEIYIDSHMKGLIPTEGVNASIREFYP